jgi:hemin uptake protein HemP
MIYAVQAAAATARNRLGSGGAMSNADLSQPSLKIVELKAAVPHSVDSRDLLRGSTHVLILHAGHVYTLRRTRENKLILTK